MHIVQELSEEKWRRFVETHPQGNIFHTPEMFRVWQQTEGHDPEVWAVMQDDVILALMLPVRITLRAGLAERLTSRAVVYGGVLVASGEVGWRALEFLLATYNQVARHRVLFTELRQIDPRAEHIPTLRARGFSEQAYLNYLIDLRQPIEQIFGAIGARTRKHIRRAQKAGRVQVIEIENSAQLDEWYLVLRATYNRARVPLADVSIFQSAFDLLIPRGLCKFWLACVDSAPAACSVELLYKQKMYGWYGGTDRAWSQYTPNELLTWHILEWGTRHAFEGYDFGGAGKAGEKYGVRDFKNKFGGQLVEDGRMVCVYSRAAMQISKIGYALFGRVFFGQPRRVGHS